MSVGASGSIGGKTAEQFAVMGGRLALTGRDQLRLKTTAEACKKAGAKHVSFYVITRYRYTSHHVKTYVLRVKPYVLRLVINRLPKSILISMFVVLC